MFFGYWKREAQRLQDAVWELEERVSELEAERQSLNREARKAEDALRVARSQLAASDLQLAAERQDNESLRRKLKSVQDEADHARHCYEQCEIDRQAIADERDAAVKQRDDAVRSAFAFSMKLNRINAILYPAKPRGTDARTDAAAAETADPESGEAAGQAGANHVPGCNGRGGCKGCIYLAAAPESGEAAGQAGPEVARCPVCKGIGCSGCAVGRDPGVIFKPHGEARYLTGPQGPRVVLDDPLYPDGP